MAVYPDNGRDPLVEAASKAVSGQSNNANINILHITAVEGLATMINEHLETLTEDTVERSNATQKAWKALAEWQKTDLHELRKVYE